MDGHDFLSQVQTSDVCGCEHSQTLSVVALGGKEACIFCISKSVDFGNCDAFTTCCFICWKLSGSEHVSLCSGEVDNMGSGMHFLTQDERYGPPAPRRSSPVASRADFVSQSFDNPGGLSRLNPNVPPRLQGPRLNDLRYAPVAVKQCSEYDISTLV